jgi:heterodisulfide reductase subunit C
MDLVPHRVIRLIQMGLRDEVLSSATVWICASCRACEARCPNDVNIARVMDYLKAQIVASHGEIPERKVFDFHRSFLDTVKSYGRAHEISMIGLYKLRSRTYFDDLAMGGRMIAKGRLPLLPQVIRGRRQIGRLFRRAHELSQQALREAKDAGKAGRWGGDRP